MKKTILCYGDSNTYGYSPADGLRYPPDVRWTGRLARILGSDYAVIEEGCNGRTTVYDDPAEGWKCGLDYLKPCLNSHKPVDLVILMLGSNDLKQIFHASARESAAGAEKLIEVIQSFTKEKQGFQPEIILVSPPEIGPDIASSPFGCSFLKSAHAESQKFSKYYQKAAERKGCIFFNAAGCIQPSREDSLHLMPDAHAVLARELARVISAL